MHDIKSIRDNPQAFRADLLRRKPDEAAADALLARLIALDDARRAAIGRAQAAQERRNAASKEIGAAMKAKDSALADKLKQEVADLKTGMGAIEAEEKAAILALEQELAAIPNRPLPDVPKGADENDNVELRLVGQKPALDFKPKEHFELGEALGLMDFEAASRHVRRAFRRAQGKAGAAGAGARPVHARPAHRPPWLSGSRAAAAGARRRHVRHGAIAQVQGRPVRGG